MRSILLAALFALVPAAVHGQTPQPTEPGPRWSIGAGVQFWTPSVSSTGLIGYPFEARFDLLTPAVGASIERAIGPRSTLVLNLWGSYDRQQQDDLAATLPAEPKAQRIGVVQVGAGLRRYVTAFDAPVDVSLVVLGHAGWAMQSRDYRYDPLTGGYPDTESRAWMLGASGGLAVDRWLTSSLALRIETQLVEAAWIDGRVETDGLPARDASELAVRAHVAPHVELRLFF